jgi:hypothetical protein
VCLGEGTRDSLFGRNTGQHFSQRRAVPRIASMNSLQLVKDALNL